MLVLFDISLMLYANNVKVPSLSILFNGKLYVGIYILLFDFINGYKESILHFANIYNPVCV